MAIMLSLRLLDIAVVLFSLSLFYILVRKTSDKSAATPLRGPPRPSFIYGLQREILASTGDNETTNKYKKWLAEYGAVFSVPWSFGTSKIILTDPKAIAHFYARETYTYVQNSLSRSAIGSLFGRGILWAEGDVHKRHRKAMTPAFSNASIRRLVSVFFDSSYKLKSVWDDIIESSHGQDGAIIEVQGWMNSLAIDSVGIAGFSFDFGALDGKEALVATSIDNFGKRSGNGSMVDPWMFLLAPVLPILLELPTGRTRVVRDLKQELSTIGTDLLNRVRKERDMGVNEQSSDNSIIGLLIKAEGNDAELYMSSEEIKAQMVHSLHTMLLPGAESLSEYPAACWLYNDINLTWSLIELSRRKEKQGKLREELSQFATSDPTFEQLASDLPYLDAVVHEILRLHPPLTQTDRDCVETDILPLSSPIITKTGQTVMSVTIPKGAQVTVPIKLMNTSKAFWGPTADEFEPERWLMSEDDSFKGLLAKEIQGHKHLLTFIDGPRTCLGKGFAIAEFKAALSVLIRNFTFEFPDGPETPLSTYRSILPRPKVEGKEGFSVPLLVRRVG